MRVLVAAIALWLLPTVVLGADPPPVTGAHNQLTCTDCHQQSQTADCSSCHEAKANLHPVGVVPSFKVAAGFELSAEGKLLCRSCHRLHGGSPKTRFLRTVEGKDPADRQAFCRSCHGVRLARSNPHDASKGVSRCSYCHASVPGGTLGGRGTARANIVKLCDFCHNVVSRDHPRNIDPSLSLPKGLPLLPDGSWTCVTCHDPHGTTETTHFVRIEFARHFERGKEENTHKDTYRACQGCHMTSIADKIRPPDYSLRYRGDVNVLCISCHMTDKSHHPTGLQPPPAVKARMDASRLRIPIDPKEGITCYTCHDNGCSTGHPLMRVRFYDRKELKNDLCWICHDRGEFAKQNPHVDDLNQCERCHVARPMKGSKTSAILVASPKMVCLLCHDVKPHPVNADHLRVPSAKIRPDGSLPMGASGEVTCTTCHDPHAQEAPRPKRLRADAAAICGRCHWR